MKLTGFGDDVTALTNITTTLLDSATQIVQGGQMPAVVCPAGTVYNGVGCVPMAVPVAQTDLPIVPMLLGAVAGYYAMDKKAFGGIVGAVAGFILGNMFRTPVTVGVTATPATPVY